MRVGRLAVPRKAAEPTVKVRAVRAAAAILLLALAGIGVSLAAGGDESAPQNTNDMVGATTDLVIDGGVTAPVSFGDRRGHASHAAVVTLFVHNQTDAPIEATALDVETDPGLVVEYLGYTRCIPECVGSGAWRTSRKVVKRSLEGRLPIEFLPPSRDTEPKGLMFRLAAAQNLAKDVVEEGCLRPVSVRLDLADGRTVEVTMPSGSAVAGIRRVFPTPAARKCSL